MCCGILTKEVERERNVVQDQISASFQDGMEENDFVYINYKQCVSERKVYEVVKRIQDIVLSAMALIVLMPLMLIIALAVVMDDPEAGPIFAQDRVGRDGKVFKFYKFRSMCANAEELKEALMEQNEMDGPVFKMKDDPRITRVGKFIRKTSLDELPQLWNVLKGDSGIIGTTKKNLDFTRVSLA